MKKILLLLILVLAGVSVNAQESEINWMSLEDALQAQASSPRKILMDAYTTWCGPCKMLDINTFQNPDVVKYVNENYYAVKFNAEGKDEISFKDRVFKNPNYDPNRATGRNSQHELATAMGITAYPTIVFFNEKGDILLPVPGYKTPVQLELYLKLFFNDDHETIGSQEQWDQYQKDFVFEFKG
jgi:thioredoxin-related protein